MNDKKYIIQIYTSAGMLSISAHPDDSYALLVCSHEREAIEKVFREDSDIMETPEADYPLRMEAGRLQVADRIGDLLRWEM